LNETDTQTIYDICLEAYAFIHTHYYYYTGVIVGMLSDDNKFRTWLEFIKYNIIGVLLVNVSLFVLVEQKAPMWAIVIFCNVVGLYFHPALKHFSSEALPKILTLITDTSLDIGKAIGKRIIDFIAKK